MAGKKRRRPIYLHVMVSEEELEQIKGRMAEAGIRNTGAYIRRMALNGYVLHVDLAPVRELVSLQRRCSNNLNQVAIQANTYGGIYPEDIKTLQKDYADLSGRFDYGQNPEKTLDGMLIRSYECDPITADAEFLLRKAKYKAITGREQRRDADVLCYQIRQSFPPGELSSEDALAIGYETAMRWTKGNYAFFVVAHVDRPHPHVHIYYIHIAGLYPEISGLPRLCPLPAAAF